MTHQARLASHAVATEIKHEATLTLELGNVDPLALKGGL